MKNFVSFFSGIGLGAVIGLLMGLSTSPTVSVVVGALATGLMALLGIKESQNTQEQAVRIGAFGLAAAAFALMGMYWRVNDTFSPELSESIAHYTEAGFSEEDARSYVLYERLGFVPESVEIDTTRKTDRGAGVLYGDDVKIEDCQRLEAYKRFTWDRQRDAAIELGGPWKRLAERIDTEVAEDQKKSMFELASDCLCDED